ncbi:MAG: FHA domain-containing protein [Alphaproteobacteria bacterium]|nr:FHA domain-containing protein [Alphaproteobacteria bacterium]
MGRISANGVGFKIPLQSVTSVGRGDDCALRLAYREVSANHAEIRWSGDHWELRDLESSNGTLINDEVVETGTWHPLEEGDWIAFGHFQIRYRLVDDGPPKGG